LIRIAHCGTDTLSSKKGAIGSFDCTHVKWGETMVSQLMMMLLVGADIADVILFYEFELE
jgi:hypothetical protein